MEKTNYIAPYIFVNEYICRHCKQLPPGFAPGLMSPFAVLFKHFEKLRVTWGKPIHIESGYRCVIHNQREGGALLSVHVFGLALDLKFASIEEKQDFYKMADATINELRIGTYKNRPRTVHIDVGYLISPIAAFSWRRGKRWAM